MMQELMKDYQPLDPKLFKAFMAAARTENFTSAAALASMTQSGVSQHMAKLEEQVGLPLFKRIGKRVVLTETGRKLVKYISEQIYSADIFLDRVRSHDVNLVGLVSYAMPPSCLLSPHFSMLLERRKKHDGITLDVRLSPSPEVVKMVLDDQVDFGFVTQLTEHPLLHHQFFCQEEYVLVGAAREGISSLSPDTLLDRRYIHYPGSDVYYNFWLRHHFPERPHLQAPSLPVAGRINSIPGAIAMVAGNLGLSVFPRHCVEDRLAAGELYEFTGSGKSPLLNDIHIVRIANYRYPLRVERVIEWFFEMKDGPC